MKKLHIKTKLMGRGLEVSTIDLTPNERKKRTKNSLHFTYESLVFHRETGEHEWDGQRYKTEQEARAGHTTLVKKWKTKTRKEVREAVDLVKSKQSR